MSVQSAYKELLALYREYEILNQAVSILEWDFETYMPEKGVDQRSEQLALLAALVHDRITNPHIGELLNEVKASSEYEFMNSYEKRNIYLLERDHTKAIRLPREFIEEYARQTTIGVHIWKRAKKEKNFEIFKPELKKIIELVKKRASLLDPEKAPYNVLLDEYEPGMTQEVYTQIFQDLKIGLLPIIEKCVTAPNKPDPTVLRRNCPISIQRKLSEDLSSVVDYDLTRGRIDETEHPFTTGYMDDVRITTHYYEDDFTNSFFSVLHEAGHGIYEQNLDSELKYQPVGASASYGLHESQSRLIENVIGRSPEFWDFYYPRLIQHTGNLFKDLEPQILYRAINNVQRSKIRVEADEMTYCLHIIIRFEIERDLMAGKIKVDQLPEIWNKKYKDYLGVEIQNDSEGVMQDTHWAGGLLGYFPTYALGSLYNAQMLHSIKKDLTDYSDLLRKGNLSPIILWLKEKIHSQGKLYDPSEFIERITGESMNAKYFLEYLEEKYSSIYGWEFQGGH
ncbi:MAG: carboxypeptidase M32 [Candidatus Heimdallarchaeota archaeon]